MQPSAKTRHKRELALKIDQSKQVNENLEAALNCLAATLHRHFPVMTVAKCKEGIGYIPLFDIHGVGVIAIKGQGFVMAKDTLTIKDKFRNLKNGYSTQGFVREVGSGIFGIRKLLARLRKSSKKNKPNEKVGEPRPEQAGYSPTPTA